MKGLKNFAKSTFWTLFYQSLSLFLNFLLNIVIARTLGPSGRGLYAVYILTPSLLSMLLSLSLDESHVYFLSKGHSTGNVFSISLVYSLVSGAFLFLSFYISPKIYFSIFKNLPQNAMLYAILITPFFLLFRYLRSIFLGTGHIKTYNFLDSMRIGILFVFISLGVLLIKPDIGIIQHAVNYHILLAVIIACILLIPDFKYGHVKTHLFSLFKNELKYGLKAYPGITMSFFNRRLDVFILNYFRTPGEVGIYSVSTALAELLWKLPNSMAIPLFPKVAKDDKKSSTEFTRFIARLTLFVLIFLGIFMVLIGRPLIIILFGHKFLASFVPLVYLLPGIVFLGVGRVLSAYFHGINKPEYGSFFTIISVIFTIVFDLVLIPSHGAEGAAIASSIAYTISGILAIFLFSKETGTNFFVMFAPPVKVMFKIINKGKG